MTQQNNKWPAIPQLQDTDNVKNQLMDLMTIIDNEENDDPVLQAFENSIHYKNHN